MGSIGPGILTEAVVVLVYMRPRRPERANFYKADVGPGPGPGRYGYEVEVVLVHVTNVRTYVRTYFDPLVYPHAYAGAAAQRS